MNKTLTILLLTILLIISCKKDDDVINPQSENTTIVDVVEDGKLNILILGTSKSYNSNSSEFSSNKIAQELERILSQDNSLELDVNVAYEDIYKSKNIDYGLGQAGTVYNLEHFSHSLMQYYYWPEGQTERWNNLSNQANNKWDYVIIGADPYIIANLPGYYALGVNKIVSKIQEGGAKPMLLMVWPKDETTTATIEHYEEFIYRTADGAKTQLKTIPVGLAWKNLPNSKKDVATKHPTPNGAYLSAAAIYSQLFNKSAAESNYVYDNEIADIALSTKISQENNTHYTGERSFVSPFKSCNIADNTLNYNHTGSSSENGILNGLQWVIAQSNKTLVNGGTPPINFNYGRANINFEPNKRYKINPSQFDFSMGFPMQDHSNHGNTSMLYGIDKRHNEFLNATDLSVALYMIRESELPNARAIPIRTLYAQLKEAIPTQSAYGDSWHMHSDLDKASGAFMYTLLTGKCILGTEPSNTSSDEWKSWVAQKIGHQTAYTLMTLKGTSQNCN